MSNEAFANCDEALTWALEEGASVERWTARGLQAPRLFVWDDRASSPRRLRSLFWCREDKRVEISTSAPSLVSETKLLMDPQGRLVERLPAHEKKWSLLVSPTTLQVSDGWIVQFESPSWAQAVCNEQHVPMPYDALCLAALRNTHALREDADVVDRILHDVATRLWDALRTARPEVLETIPYWPRHLEAVLARMPARYKMQLRRAMGAYNSVEELCLRVTCILLGHAREQRSSLWFATMTEDPERVLEQARRLQPHMHFPTFLELVKELAPPATASP